MAKYRKRPAVIDAFQLHDADWQAIREFLGLHAVDGDWLIHTEDGKMSICKPDIFERTYELVDAGSSPSEPRKNFVGAGGWDDDVPKRSNP